VSHSSSSISGSEILRLGRDERLGAHVGFWWGLAEGLFFFIVPDVYISFATLFALRAGAIAWLWSIAGSVVAIPIIYLLVAVFRLDYMGFLQKLPAISASMIRETGDRLALEGLPYTPFLVFGGVPLKLYAASAFSLGLSLGAVLVWTVFARIVRIAPTYAVAAGLRLLFSHRIDHRPYAWLAVLGLFWIVFYAFYFSSR
jgi:hypothetical protein